MFFVMPNATRKLLPKSWAHLEALSESEFGRRLFDDALDGRGRQAAPANRGGEYDEETALEQALAYLGRRPATGSPRYAHELNIPGLRSWTLDRFPYLVFCVERSDHLDVWRVLHGKRDIPAWMSDPDDA